MSILGSLQVRLGLDASTFASNFNRFSRATEKKVKAFQKSLSGIGNFGTMLGGAGLAAGLADVVSTAGDFQQSLSQVAAASGATGAEMQSLSDLALQMGRTTVFGANQVAAAMLDLGKAGISPAQMEAGTLAATLQLAATEGMDLSRAAEVIAEQMGAFGLSAEDSAAIADALAGAAIASTASVEGLAQALSQSAAVAHLSGASINDTAGALALLAQNGIKGSDAGTSLKTMMLRLVPPTKEAAVAMKKYGLSFKDSTGKVDSLTVVAGKLQDRLGKLSQAEKQSAMQTIFGTDAYRSAAIIMQGGTAELEKYISATRDKNAAEKLSEARTSGFNGAMARLKNSFESLKIEIAKGGLLDFLSGIADKATSAFSVFAQAPPWLKNTALGIAAAAALLPPLAFGLSTVAGVIPMFSGLVAGLTATALGPLGIVLIGLGYAMSKFSGSFSESFASLSTTNKTYVDDLKSAWADLGASAKSLWDEIGKWFADGSTDLGISAEQTSTDLKYFSTTWDEAVTGVVAAAELIIEWIKALVDGLRDFCQFIREEWNETVLPFITSLSDMSDTARSKLKDAENYVFDMANGAGKWFGDMSDSIFGTSEALEDFGETGKKVADEAVGHSWLTDLCQIGIENLRKFVSDGVNPAADSLSSFGGVGESLKIDLPDGTAKSYGARDRFKSLTESSSRAASDFESAWSISLRDTHQAIDEFVRSGSLRFNDLMKSIVADIAAAQLRKAATGLFEGVANSIGNLFGGSSSGSSGGSGGFFGSLASIGGGIFKALTSFEGGGFTGATARTGGVDGKGGFPAILHPRETVIDHAAIGKAARKSAVSSVTVSAPITLMPGVSREELARIIPEVQRNIIEIIPALVRRGGRYASAFGQ